MNDHLVTPSPVNRMTPLSRNELYDRTPEASEAHRQRCLADMREARARGWVSVEVSQIYEPPLPMGYPPAYHPRRAEADAIQPSGGVVPLPEYGAGEEGGYSHAIAPAPNAPTPTASNAPTAPRTFGWLATRVQRWLGIADQRHDFDALAMTLDVRDKLNNQLNDQRTDGARRDIDRIAGLLRGFTEQLNRTTRGAASTDDRLSFYEARVTMLVRAKRTYDAWIAREIKRRERLIAANPELSEEAKAYVRATGKLPETNGAAKPQVPPE